MALVLLLTAAVLGVAADASAASRHAARRSPRRARAHFESTESPTAPEPRQPAAHDRLAPISDTQASDAPRRRRPPDGRVERTLETEGTQSLLTETFDYDGLDRLTRSTSPSGEVQFEYGLLGNLALGRIAVNGGPTHEWSVTPYADATPMSTTYPSHAQVTTRRDDHGRLTTLSVDTATVARVLDHAMAAAPGRVGLGNGVTRRDVFDPDRRLVRREYSSAARVVEVRYDGLSRLMRVDAARGARIDYVHRADGPLLRRTVTCTAVTTGCQPTTMEYVYDGLRLLEEHNAQGVVARYYYADEGEIPIAADLGTPATRYYFVTDRVGSVIGVLDAQGSWVERVRYDAWVRPTCEPADTVAPQIAEIRIEPSGDILVAFTERVQPKLAPPAPNDDGITTATLDLTAAFELVDATGLVPATAELDDTAFGYPRGTVVRLRPNTIAPGARVTLTLHSGVVVDDWNNAAATVTRAFNYAANTTPYAGPAFGSTSLAPTERSLVGNDELAEQQGRKWWKVAQASMQRRSR